MSDVLPDDFAWAEEQPYGVEIKMSDGIFIKQMVIPRAGTYIPQHSHLYDHTSMLAAGSIRVWKDGECLGEFSAPTGILIEAGAKHTFLALEDGTTIYCIHNISRTGEVDIQDEHHVPGVI